MTINSYRISDLKIILNVLISEGIKMLFQDNMIVIQAD